MVRSSGAKASAHACISKGWPAAAAPANDVSLAEALEASGESELVNYLRTVSLPHAEERYALISELRGGKAVDVRLSPAD